MTPVLTFFMTVFSLYAGIKISEAFMVKKNPRAGWSLATGYLVIYTFYAIFVFNISFS